MEKTNQLCFKATNGCN